MSVTYVIAPKRLSHPKSVMSWWQKVRHYLKSSSHDVKNVSWCQNVCYDVKKFVMKSKTFHDVNTFVMTSKDVMTSISSSWCQSISWRQIVRYDIKKFIMMSKTCCLSKNVSWRKEHTMTLKLKSSSWRQKVCHASKPSMTSKRSPWCQKVLHTLWHQKVGYIKN